MSCLREYSGSRKTIRFYAGLFYYPSVTRDAYVSSGLEQKCSTVFLGKSRAYDYLHTGLIYKLIQMSVSGEIGGHPQITSHVKGGRGSTKCDIV